MIDDAMKEYQKWYAKQYYWTNRDRNRERNKRWSDANKERRSEYNKRYWKENKEQIMRQRKADTAPAPKRSKRIKTAEGLPVQRILRS